MRSTISYNVNNIPILKKHISDILEHTAKHVRKNAYGVRSTVKLISPLKTVYITGYNDNFDIIADTQDYCEIMKANNLYTDDEYCVLSDVTILNEPCDKYFVIQTEFNKDCKIM